MKKILSVLLAVCLLCSLMPFAFADSPVLAITEEVLQALDNEDFSYDFENLDTTEFAEIISVSLEWENLSDQPVVAYIYEEDSSVEFCCEDFMAYDVSDFFEVLQAVNQLNFAGTDVRFYCNEELNTVSAEFDGYLMDGTAGDTAVEMLYSMWAFVDSAYGDVLSAYAI